jgi:hypothetical protein
MVAVHTLSWEEVSSPDFGTPARQAWREAVAEVAAKAKATLPQCNGRVDKAVAIVLAGDVELLDDGKARVASQSNGQTVYHIANGECDCQDYPKAPSNWCKHRIARGVHVRALALAKEKLAQREASPAQAEAPSQPAPTAPLPEAPVSITLKGRMHGQEVMVTLRGVDFASVKAQVEDASQWLQGQGASTVHEADAPPALPRCTKHDATLQRFERGRRVWHSHKLADGSWCKGQ